MRRLPVLCAALLLATGAVFAQSVISAHSGVVHYIEGRVLLDGHPVISKFGQFPELKDNHELRTEEGRAEMLLTPGVFLRIGENSSVRMISNRLTDTRVEVLTGAALVECGEILKDNAITLIYKDWAVQLQKKGVYRLDGDPARLRVYDGEALVKGSNQEASVKKSKELFFGAVLSADKFESKETDELYSWSSHRSESLSYANISAAKSLLDGGSSYGYGYGSGFGSGFGSGYGYGGMNGWQWNPWYGMFTYVPYNGVYFSPFGFGFWSPSQVGNFYQPGFWGGGLNTIRSTPVVNTTSRLGSNLGATSVARGTMATSSANLGRASFGGGAASGGTASGGGRMTGGGGSSMIGAGRSSGGGSHR